MIWVAVGVPFIALLAGCVWFGVWFAREDWNELYGLPPRNIGKSDE